MKRYFFENKRNNSIIYINTNPKKGGKKYVIYNTKLKEVADMSDTPLSNILKNLQLILSAKKDKKKGAVKSNMVYTLISETVAKRKVESVGLKLVDDPVQTGIVFQQYLFY